MRADAKENYNHLLATARVVIAEDGAGASLRDIARKAGMGLATLLRHFPSREALLDALLRTSLDALIEKAHQLEASHSADDALRLWLREAVNFVRVYRGAVDMMATALADPNSALYASCKALRMAGGRLLHNAQAAGKANPCISESDLFALLGALGWLGDQAAFAERSEHLFNFIADALLTSK